MSDDDGMKPRLLLVEDDPISARFMRLVLEALPARVDAVALAAQALASPSPHDLWLIDAHLPDGSGEQLLAALRQGRPATVALAHTADPSPSMRESLLSAGFADVLVKPVSAAALQSAVRAHLPAGSAATAADWDQDAALKALNGNGEHVAMLRKLFLDELPASVATVGHAFRCDDQDGLRGALHKLRASCGFVGAARLAAAVEALQQSPRDAASLAAFDAAAKTLLLHPL